MRKISANYIFPISGEPLKNGIVILDDNNVVTNVIDTKGDLHDSEKLEFYNGIIVPGFVNTHCHLELSYMKGMIPQHTGISGFIDGIIQKREISQEAITESIRKFNDRMISEGIVAIGDISNTQNSFPEKKNSKIKYYTFIEIFEFNKSKAESVFNKGVKLFEELTNEFGLTGSIVPHAPHTVSNRLFELINNHAEQAGGILSFHNQECAEENELFLTMSGKLYNKLVEIRNGNTNGIELSGLSSLKTVYQKFPKKNHVLFIHNTFTSEHDIDIANNYFENVFWTFCPNSNLYIENTLPDVMLFYNKKQKITLGTDSLASNTKLSMLEEIKTINFNFPQIPIQEIFKWATLNGAEALKFDNEFGSIDIGKKPGINLIENVDLQNMKLIEKSFVRVLA